MIQICQKVDNITSSILIVLKGAHGQSNRLSQQFMVSQTHGGLKIKTKYTLLHQAFQFLKMQKLTLMMYCLAPVVHCLGTPDVLLEKPNKASMFHFIMEKDTEEISYPKKSLFTQDNNAFFHNFCDLQPTFSGICLHIILILSTISYNPNSMKSQERQRHGCNEMLQLEGSNTHMPKEIPTKVISEKIPTRLISVNC